jgi:hypothetical protein
MYDQNSINIRGIKHEQHKAIVGGHQGTFSMRGIIEQVDIHNQMAVIAVEGGESTANAFKNLIAVHTKEGKERIETIRESVGSNYTRFAVKIPASAAQGSGGSTAGVVPGTHVIVHFTRGLFRPTIQNYEILLNSGDNEDSSVIYIDNSSSTPSFKILTGAGDVNWTGNPGLAGHRFAAFSQNPEGGQVSVSSNNKYKNLLKDPTKITPQLIKEVKKPSTPSGSASWVDKNDAGNHAVFGDKVHILSKEVSKTSLGSNMPQASTIQTVTKALAEANGTDVEKPAVNVVSASKPDYAISPIISTLAKEELILYKSGLPGFLNSIVVTDTVYNKQSKNSEVLNNFTDEHALSVRLSQSMVSALLDYKSILVDDVQSFINLNFSDSSLINPLLASLVFAIRLSIIKNTYSGLLNSYLESQELSVLTYDSNLNLRGYASIPNFFGLFVEEGNVANSVLNNIDLSKYPADIKAKFQNNVSRTYDDLVSYNLFELQGKINSSWNTNNVLLSNSLKMGNGINTLPFLMDDSSEKEKELTKDEQSSWMFGVWSAQAAVVIQEILNAAYEFSNEVKSSKYAEDIKIVKQKRNFKVVDDSGKEITLNVGYLDSSFVIYAVLKLFSGTLGYSVASAFLTSVKESLEASTETNLETLFRTIVTDSSQYPTVTDVWVKSLLERTKFIANTMSRFGMVVRS